MSTHRKDDAGYRNPMNPKDEIPDIAAMKEASADEQRRLAYENHHLREKVKELERTNDELIVMQHKVIKFASEISLEETGEDIDRGRPFLEILKELTTRVESKYAKTSILETVNERFRKQLVTLRIENQRFREELEALRNKSANDSDN
jgi:regulator of replication initiation timing